jgi:hypothetical protein
MQKKAAMLKQRDDGDIGKHWSDMKAFIENYKKNKGQGSMKEIQEEAKVVASSEFIEGDWEANE